MFFHNENRRQRALALTEQLRERLHVLDRRISWGEYHAFLRDRAKAAELISPEPTMTTSLEGCAHQRIRIEEADALVLKHYPQGFQLLDSLIDAIKAARIFESQTQKSRDDEQYWRDFLILLIDIGVELTLVEVEFGIEEQTKQ